MRIGICINRAWNIFNFRSCLVKAFLKEGHEVVAIAPPEKAYEEKLIAMGCEFWPVAMESKGANPLNDLALIFRLKEAYQKSRIDIILHYTIKPNIYGTFAAKLLKIPAINNVTGLGTVFLRKNLTAKMAYALYRVAFRYPNKVFFQNSDDRALFLQMGLIKEPLTGLLPGSGVDLKRFSPISIPRNEPFRFLMIARLLYDKGIVEYMEAAKNLKEQGIGAVFQILGKIETDAGLGVSKAQVQEWVDKGYISYLGLTDDVKSVIASVDCVVLPSYREGTPRTLLEASSMAKPLVATNVPGCKEVVQEGYNGFLCKEKNSQSLATALERIYRLDAEELATLGRNSRQLAEEKFSDELVVSAYLAEIKAIFAE